MGDEKWEMRKVRSIFIVEDDPEMCITLENILSEEGYTVKTACSGGEALRLARKEEYSVCLLDLELPDISGIEVLKHLKAFNPDMCVIVITAYESKEKAIEALKAGAYYYMYMHNEKTVNRAELLVTVKRAYDTYQLLEDKKRVEDELRWSEESIAHSCSPPGILSIS